MDNQTHKYIQMQCFCIPANGMGRCNVVGLWMPGEERLHKSVFLVLMRVQFLFRIHTMCIPEMGPEAAVRAFCSLLNVFLAVLRS